ncbi:hypothetical protein HDF26_001062 [Pedobacter cryoconitis]|uniref:hypothetical protein n=1 Tax=Pedobacter cryoconitis TaxID=188932 RepID=UPI00161A5A97|nr:hypothetical protein [Pedobacter cryoconitis]MBB6270635.1 hypothetical protein [Pedobacter cryoconitis]
MKNKLYNEFAGYYAKLTSNRDFKNQIALILNTYDHENPCKTFIELFAGQAVHSIEAIQRTGIDVWAADSSPEMKLLAISEGFENPDQYIVGELPGSMIQTGDVKFDCVACLYSAFSALPMQEVFELLKKIKQALSSHGKLFIELHDIVDTMEYIANPIISYKEVAGTREERIKYAWPSAKINWDRYSHTAEVPVQLIIQSPESNDTIEFISTDHIYSAEEIIFMANLLDYECKIRTTDQLWLEVFDRGIVLELTLR